MPKRIQLRRTKGWRMPEHTVHVARPSKWGNPYVIGRKDPFRPGFIDDRGRAVELYRWGVENGCVTVPYTRIALPDGRESFGAHTVLEVVHQLRGKNLACWCPLDQPCHADVLLELANK